MEYQFILIGAKEQVNEINLRKGYGKKFFFQNGSEFICGR